MKRCPVCKTVYPDDANFCPMDASTLDDEPAAPGVQASLDLPTMMAKLVGGRFRLGPQIGGRRTGEVFSAEDITNGAAVAVKLVSPAVFPTPLVAQRTERELKQLMKVTSDRVTRVLDVGKQGDRLYVALELVSGVTLAELVATNGPLPIDQAVRLSLEVGEALAEAAKLGVIHRDVSPKNVLVVADERVASGRRIKLINFGVPTPSSDHKVHGTPEFLSPEQAEGKPVDQRSNIYSLGTLLYFLLTGTTPFSGDAAKVLRDQAAASPVPPSQKVQGVPAEIERLILKAMEKASSRRHLTLRQLLGEMESALAHLPISSPVPLPHTASPGGAGQPRSSAQARRSGAIPAQRPSAAHPAPERPSQRHHQVSSKTMVGIGLKDILPHLDVGKEKAGAPQLHAEPPPPSAPAPAPRATKPQAVIVPDPPPPELPANLASIAQPIAAHQPMVPPVEPRRQPVLLETPAVTSSAAPARGKSSPTEHPPSEKEASSGARKGKFRETMWFKKGEVEEAEAEEAVEHPSGSLPIEDRYKDDGTLTAADRERLSLRTGGTQVHVPKAKGGGGTGKVQAIPGKRMSEEDLIGELRGGRTRTLMLIAAIALAVVLLFVYFAFIR